MPVTILTATGGQSAAGAATFTYWVPASSAAIAPAAVTGGRGEAAAAAQAMAARPRAASAPAATAGGAGPSGAFAPVSPFAQALGAAGVIAAKMASSCEAARAGTAFTTALNRTLARAASDLGRPHGWVGAAGGLTGGAAGLLSAVLQTSYSRGLQPFTDGGLTVPELIATGALTAAVNGLARHGASLGAMETDLSCAAAVLYPPPASAPSPVMFQARAVPAGTVVDTSGHPVAGATVTLLYAPDLAQPFSPLAAGSPLMDPSVNPQVTSAHGTFGWNLLGGRYEVAATKAGCGAPGHPGQLAVTSPAFRGVPPQARLVLTLSCSG